MDETPDDRDTPSADGTQPARRLSRRWFVAGGAALVVGGAAGVAFDLARGAPAPARPMQLPAALHTALADERALLTAARGAGGDVPAGIAASIVRDHEAHLAALTAAAAGFAPTKHRSPAGPSTSADTGGRAVLRRLERRAAHRTARHARQSTGDVAALLASIAACEATHAELLA